MKYHVYAALIATTQAGPIADAFEKNMPTPEEVEYAETKLNGWADSAENITKTAKPIIKNRNQKNLESENNETGFQQTQQIQQRAEPED